MQRVTRFVATGGIGAIFPDAAFCCLEPGEE